MEDIIVTKEEKPVSFKYSHYQVLHTALQHSVEMTFMINPSQNLLGTYR